MRKNDSKSRILMPENFFVRMNRLILISFVLLLLPVIAHGQSTTVFFDNFDRGSSNSFPGPGGTPVVNWSPFSTLDPTARIVVWSGSTGSYEGDMVFQIFGTNTEANTGSAGRSYMVGPLADFNSIFKSKLKDNLADVTWTFNWTNSRSGALNGFTLSNTNYGQAVVLAATSNDLMTANGYAVTLTGNSSGNERIVRIVRFANGLVHNSNITTIVTSTIGTLVGRNASSVKVIYSPSTNTWKLYIRDDGGTALAKDPMIEDGTNGFYTLIGSAVNDTYTDVSMTSCGFFYNHGIASTASSAKANFDNFGVSVAVDASLSDLRVSLDADNYATPMLFDPATKNYLYYLTKDHALPLVAADATDVNATVDIVQPVNLRGTEAERTATITVTSVNPEYTEVYTVEFIETNNIYQSGMGNANGTTEGGDAPEFVPEGWSHSNMYFSGVIADGNNKFEGAACVRQKLNSTSATLTLPVMSGIGTLRFFARKSEEGVLGSIRILMQKDGGDWTEVYNLGDIESLIYQEFIIPINQVASVSMLVRIEVTKNGDTFESEGYFLDDFSYTAPDISTSRTNLNDASFTLHDVPNGFAIDVEYARVEIFNITGVLQQSAVIKGSHQFIMNNPGMYIIRISTASGKINTKYLVR